jgi:group I intron endonuclease
MANEQFHNRKYTCYALKNKINKKIYVGITVNLEQRIASHFSDLKRGDHHNKGLSSDYKKFGNCFEVYKMEENISFWDKSDKELMYILKLKSYIPEFGYNLKDSRVANIFKQEVKIISGIPDIG